MDGERAEIDAVRAATGFTGPIPSAGEAQRLADRNGDFSAIRLRLDLGIRLSSGELAAIDRLERGAQLRSGPKNPATAFETVVCWRWLVERAGCSVSDAYSLLAEMEGVTPDAIKGRVKRAKGIGANIAAISYDLHVQRDAVPALLQSRTGTGHCSTCGKVRCRCQPAPRPAFGDTSEGAIVAALLGFWAR